ncbi:hypothetical protein DRO37_04115 [Candidatus Bathyarchaeota archaeon]|nr:MAG: hypothetical protein DRO37_04115 [Candidatus Bathyarchaeota archaeon]
MQKEKQTSLPLKFNSTLQRHRFKHLLLLCPPHREYPQQFYNIPVKLFMNVKSMMFGRKELTQQKIYLKINLEFLVSASI